MIPITKPFFGEEEARAAANTVLSGWVTQGPRVQEFEEAFAASVGAKYACAVSNCANALQLAMLSLSVEPGDVVLTVSHSFIATANSVRHCGAEPIFVDIESSTGNMDPKALARILREDCEARDGRLWYKKVGDLAKAGFPLADKAAAGQTLGRVAAVMPVHQTGIPCAMEEILRLAREHGLPVVEDAACAVGSELAVNGAWRGIGAPHGDIACFSFHPRKIITTGEGGMLTMNAVEHQRTCRLLRNQGMDLSDIERHSADGIAIESYLTMGYNFRMTDIQAAIGLKQLDRVPEIVRRRRSLAEAYAAALEGVPGVRLLQEPSYARANWQTFVILLEPPLEQARAMRFLREQGVSSRRGIMCAHLEPPYAGLWPAGNLPNSEASSRQGLVVPMFPEMDLKDVDTVAQALRKFAALGGS